MVGRTPFDADAYRGGLRRTGRRARRDRPDAVRDRADAAAGAEERGFKDTVKVNPGYLHDHPGEVRPADARHRRRRRYVYHCHIVEHEDNDMMRPFTVTP